jgi:hypothetical protein
MLIPSPKRRCTMQAKGPYRTRIATFNIGDFSGVGFATNEQIEEAIWKLQNLSDKELELTNE